MSTRLHPPIWLLVLLLLTVVACTAQEPTPAGSEVASGETPSPVAGDAVAATMPATEALASPSPTPSPPATTPPATPTRPAANPPAAPSGLEPTATPTATLPTPLLPSPTSTPVPTSSIVPGWLTYQNDLLGYSFSYPPEAEIGVTGVAGFPDEELPENMTTDEYLEYLKSIYPGGLCVSVRYKRGYLVVFPRGETGVARYVGMCGRTGVGDYMMEEREEAVTIDGQSYTVIGYRNYEWQSNQLVEEFYILLDVNDNLRFDFGVNWSSTTSRSTQQQLTEQEYNEIRETLLQILASFRFFSPQADGE